MSRKIDKDGRDVRTFADRLREAVNETSATERRAGRHRQRRAPRPVFSPTANPGRVRYSDELFVDRIRNAMD